jgi:hypothetical protein
MSELDPTPELPDDTPIARVRFPIRIRNVLEAAGLKTIGEVREIADDTLLSSYDFRLRRPAPRDPWPAVMPWCAAGPARLRVF